MGTKAFSSDVLRTGCMKESCILAMDIEKLKLNLPAPSEVTFKWLGTASSRWKEVVEDVEQRVVATSYGETTSKGCSDTSDGCGCSGDDRFIPDAVRRQCQHSSQLRASFLYANLTVHVILKTIGSRIGIRSYVTEKVEMIDVVHLLAMLYLFASDKLRAVYLTFCPTLGRKVLPQGELLESKHVNSGFTTVSGSSCSVCVWRTEEAAKVGIHEIIHVINSSGNSSSQRITLDFRNMFAYPLDTLLLDEGYTEALALIYHCFRLGRKLNTPWDDVLRLERHFAVFQAAKLLAFQGFHTLSEVVSVSAVKADIGRQKDSTNAFCYHFIKAAIIFDLNGFVDVLRSNTTLVENVDWTRLIAHIRQVVLGEAFSRCIDTCLEWLNKYRHRLSAESLSSMRMTCLETRA